MKGNEQTIYCFDRCPVGKPVTLSARTFTTRQTSQVGDALNYQRYVLSPQVRVSVANAPSSDATMANYYFRKHMVYDSVEDF